MAGTDRSPSQDVPVEQRSLGELFSSATRDMSTLVRSEIELAKSEVKVSVVNVAKGGGALGAAAFIGVFAFIFLSFAAVYGIHALGLGLAWAFLIVGGAYLLLTALLGLIGLKSLKKVRPPRRTIASAKDTVTALKQVG